MQTGTVGRLLVSAIMRIGGGVVGETAEVLAQLGLSRPFVVTDPGVAGLHSARLTDVLDGAGVDHAVFADVIPDPTDVCLDAALSAFRAGDYDCVIGFGGGSPMDVAKAVSLRAVNPGHVHDYKAPTQITRSGVPIILIPTTGGTGSGVTRWCVISDTASPEKYNLSGPACVATAAVVDWTFTVAKPARITADTAVDSLTHAIEAYVSRRAFPYTDALALAAMPLITDHVRRAYADPEDGAAHEALMLAATQAGMAFSNASVALVHGMSRPIGAHFHVAHGLSNAMLLPAVTAFSVGAAPMRYATCARVMGLADGGDNDAVACEKLVAGLRQLNADLAVPAPSDLGHQADDAIWTLMAEQAFASGSPGNNPRVPTVVEIVGLYREMW